MYLVLKVAAEKKKKRKPNVDTHTVGSEKKSIGNAEWDSWVLITIYTQTFVSFFTSMRYRSGYATGFPLFSCHGSLRKAVTLFRTLPSQRFMHVNKNNSLKARCNFS